ncbi:MAG: tetratricopeptide repeat protein [candidate division KSB1 bacterium]|nr:tetratricopeptide repeat protein [candidate division KSB1 bacterium]
MPSEACGKEAEAHYDVGICYAWLGKKDSAEVIFQQVINTYPDNMEVVAYSRYGLSWVDVQRGKFQPAIERLQQLLDQKIYSDKEFCARVQFEIGRIYLVFLHQAEQAEQAFRKVLENYPDAEVANHPFLAKLKGN